MKLWPLRQSWYTTNCDPVDYEQHTCSETAGGRSDTGEYWICGGQKGSHKQFRHEDGRGTTVPFHKGRDISRLLRQIASDISLTIEEMLESR